MGVSEMPEQMSYYPTLTQEEKARMHPCRKAKCVMMSADLSPTLQASIPSAGYIDLPDEPRPGKITRSSPSNTSNSTPSPRDSKSEAGSGGNGGTSSSEAEEVIEEAVPIVRSTLPSPEPCPMIELSRNGYKDHDVVDSNGIKMKPVQHEIDDDSCLIKCVYFTQQCCECTIV